MNSCEMYRPNSQLTSPQTFNLLRKVSFLLRFNVDIQAVIWLPCKHTYTQTHGHSQKYTNTHPWATSQKHRLHSSESPSNKTAGLVKPTLRKDVWSIYSSDSMRI